MKKILAVLSVFIFCLLVGGTAVASGPPQDIDAQGRPPNEPYNIKTVQPPGHDREGVPGGPPVDTPVDTPFT